MVWNQSRQNSRMRRPSPPSRMGQQHRQLFVSPLRLKTGGRRHSITIFERSRPSPHGRSGSDFASALCPFGAPPRGYGHTDGRTGFGAPHVKPSVRPSIYPHSRQSPELDPFPWGKSKNAANTGPAATKLYSPRPCTRRPSRHICVNCHAPGMRGRQPGPSGFILTQ